MELMRSLFHETLYKYKASSEDAHITSTIAPPTFFTELCPFENFEYWKSSPSITLKPF